MLRLAIIISFLAIGAAGYAGIDDDSLTTNVNEEQHITRRAAIWSAIIPGTGQIYNEVGYRRISNKKHRAWWKVPLIYGGLGACGYYYYQNNKFANLTKQEWLFRKNNEGAILDERFADYPFNEADTTYEVSSLIEGYEDVNGNTVNGFTTFSRRRDIFIFAFIGVWGLNVIEAYVDAHFVTFDVSENLSLSAYPTMLGPRYPGLSLQLNFN